jgi:hypothetical protein
MMWNPGVGQQKMARSSIDQLNQLKLRGGAGLTDIESSRNRV